MTLKEYLDRNDLWDEALLGVHCNANHVYMRKSDKYPGLFLLHYSDDASYSRAWNEFNMMCRGAIINIEEKKIVAWPFDKFFNLGEHETSSVDRLNGKFTATEKLDGSMLILFPYKGRNYFTTKGSFDSEHAEYANANMPEVLKHLPCTDKMTLMFELISGKFRNVIDYKKKGYSDGNYLIGCREIETGILSTNEQITVTANLIGAPFFMISAFLTIEEAVDWAYNLPADQEGYVLKFNDEQLLVKVKGKDYVYAHKVMKGMNDNAVVDAILDNKANELITFCPEEYRDEVKERFAVIERAKDKFLKEANESLKKILASKNLVSRKDFALAINGDAKKEHRKMMFKVLDGVQKKELENMAYNHIKQNMIHNGTFSEA